jgi:DNA polymerase-4
VILAKTVTLKVKYTDFNQITLSRTISLPVADVRELASLVDVLLTPVFPTDKGIRLLGVTLSSLERSGETTQPQLMLSLA